MAFVAFVAQHVLLASRCLSGNERRTGVAGFLMKYATMPSLKEVYQKLVTKEDEYGIHKMLGISCLLSFLYRFSGFGRELDCRFASGGVETLFFIALHLSLNLSSFLFDIPQKRIKKGYRIWPEARIHALVFVSRSLALILLLWIQDTYSENEIIKASRKYDALLNTLVVLLACAAADLGSRSVGDKYRSKTIRELEAPPMARYCFSVIQIYGTVACLFTSYSGRYTIQFIFIWIIQLNAFMMTLRRKNLAGHDLLIATYALLLVAGFTLKTIVDYSVGQWTFWFLNTCLANTAAILRMNGVNKYFLWTAIGVSLQYLIQPDDLNLEGLKLANMISFLVVALVGFQKVASESSSAITKAA